MILVYDNCDPNVECLHAFTMHATNGIIIQSILDIALVESEQDTSPISKSRESDSFKPIWRE